MQPGSPVAAVVDSATITPLRWLLPDAYQARGHPGVGADSISGQVSERDPTALTLCPVDLERPPARTPAVADEGRSWGVAGGRQPGGLGEPQEVVFWSVPVFMDTGLCRDLVDVPIA